MNRLNILYWFKSSKQFFVRTHLIALVQKITHAKPEIHGQMSLANVCFYFQSVPYIHVTFGTYGYIKIQ